MQMLKEKHLYEYNGIQKWNFITKLKKYFKEGYLKKYDNNLKWYDSWYDVPWVAGNSKYTQGWIENMTRINSQCNWILYTNKI